MNYKLSDIKVFLTLLTMRNKPLAHTPSKRDIQRDQPGQTLVMGQSSSIDCDDIFVECHGPEQGARSLVEANFVTSSRNAPAKQGAFH